MSSPNFLCSICFNPILSNDYQIDERGWPVHKKCHAERALHTGPANKKPPKKKISIGGTLRRAG
jgi:hypothetical protein